MISKDIQKICKTPELIENYDKAIADTTQTWHCHHRLETDKNMSSSELISKNLYLDRPPSELIFLEPHEHLSLKHNVFSKRRNGVKSTYSYLKNRQKRGVYHKDTNTWYSSVEKASKALGYSVKAIRMMLKDEESDFSRTRPVSY